MKRILVLFINPREIYLKEMHDFPFDKYRQYFESMKAPDTEVGMKFPPLEEFAGVGIGNSHTEYNLAMGTPYMVRACVEAEKEGYSAVLIHGTYDPGVDAARHVVDIPVIAPGRVGLHMAGMLADKVCILVYHEDIVPYLWRYIGSLGLEKLVCSIKSFRIPTNVENFDEIFKTVKVVVREAVQEGAQMIVPFTGLLTPMRMSTKELEKEVGVPVLDPYWAAFKVCEMLVDMKVTNNRGAYPTPGWVKKY